MIIAILLAHSFRKEIDDCMSHPRADVQIKTWSNHRAAYIPVLFEFRMITDFPANETTIIHSERNLSKAGLTSRKHYLWKVLDVCQTLSDSTQLRKSCFAFSLQSYSKN